MVEFKIGDRVKIINGLILVGRFGFITDIRYDLPMGKGEAIYIIDNIIDDGVVYNNLYMVFDELEIDRQKYRNDILNNILE